MIRVALDAMGGDLGPRIAFDGAVEILSRHQDVVITIYYSPNSGLVLPAPHERLSLIACSDVIDGDEEIVLSLFRRRNSTLYQSLNSLAQRSSDVVVTLGNTGAMVALARHILGVLRPKLYPALIRELYSNPLRCLVDLGANVHCPPSMLVGFAELGAAYIEALSDEEPRVGLLNVGVESSKGSAVIRETDRLLAANEWPDYFGYAEGTELFDGDKNVIVCDGMVGNAVLKASEGLLSFMMNKFKGMDEASSLFETFYQTERRHGACLVGVRGNLVKGHGRSDLSAMIGAIEYGVDIARADLYSAIEARLCS
ncbi:fatty acid synthesis protein [Marinomonas rhizomae]|uniref:Phosphate acyltransferase n=1 Tax=Marinomonas rhizomae TaxID=491948 RepID=A0A366JCA0_9GAMM|nr:fatty acid synthesis protein [Marinomonas rhizomae]RBP84621.1 phosphate:acyl-[acyl carrier protein] acyltransferase [Marinomonas rhizomae]RNF75174.1 fatty acid synthesis protein [Marinomonas rhizomae]